MANPIQRPETDIDRLLQMLVKDFPFDFFVKQGGDEVRISVNGSGRVLVLARDGKWAYE